jgi:hypothetical protein
VSQQLWTPGSAGPQEDFVDRVHRRIEKFAAQAGVERAFVEIELADGVRYVVESILAEPGYGFVTIHPHPADGVPGEVIVPVGSIKRFELNAAAEEQMRFGFSIPAQ